MPQLDFAHYPFLSQIFWLFLSFAVLYFAMSRIVLPRISKVLEIRDDTISSAISEAERVKDQAKKQDVKGGDDLSTARAEANKLLKEAQDNIASKTKRELAKADQQIADQIAESENKIKKMRKDSAKDVEALIEQTYKDLVKNYL